MHASADACLAELEQLHQFVYRQLGDELLWCASMPCHLPEEKAIPIAQFGRSNVGRAKTVYRIGLSHRYGRRMQLISGVHYNFSLPEDAWPIAGLGDANEVYFALIRNFRRHAWLLLYLFGASPAVCASFVDGRAHELLELAPGTLYLPFATSLRMGRLGYLSEAQDALCVSYNDLESYAASLTDALTRPYPAYEAIGIRDGDDIVSSPPACCRSRMSSTARSVPSASSGPASGRFTPCGSVACSTSKCGPWTSIRSRRSASPPIPPVSSTCSSSTACSRRAPPIRQTRFVRWPRTSTGRPHAVASPGCGLDRNGRSVELREWAAQLLDECAPIAAALDTANGGCLHDAALSAAVRALDEPESLPSARVLREIRQHHAGSYERFVLAYSLRHRTRCSKSRCRPTWKRDSSAWPKRRS